jgi:MFS family permease
MSTMPLFVTNSLNSGSKESGIVVTIFIIAAMLFRFFSGKLIDRFGKKKIVFLSAILFLGCSSFYLIVESLTQLLLLRFIHGMSFGIASTATGAIAADILPSDRKGEGIGYYNLSYTTAIFFWTISRTSYNRSIRFFSIF